MKSSTKKAPVTVRALIQRINRKLAPDGRTLKVARGQAIEFVGTYYVIDHGLDEVAMRNIDLQTYGKKIGVLMAWEELSK